MSNKCYILITYPKPYSLSHLRKSSFHYLKLCVFHSRLLYQNFCMPMNPSWQCHYSQTILLISFKSSILTFLDSSSPVMLLFYRSIIRFLSGFSLKYRQYKWSCFSSPLSVTYSYRSLPILSKRPRQLALFLSVISKCKRSYRIIIVR